MPVATTASPHLAGCLQGALVDLVELYLQVKHVQWNGSGPGWWELSLRLDEVAGTAVVTADQLAAVMLGLGTAPDARTDSVALATSLPTAPMGRLDSVEAADQTARRIAVTATGLRAIHARTAEEDTATARFLIDSARHLEELAWRLRAPRRPPTAA